MYVVIIVYFWNGVKYFDSVLVVIILFVFLLRTCVLILRYALFFQMRNVFDSLMILSNVCFDFCKIQLRI